MAVHEDEGTNIVAGCGGQAAAQPEPQRGGLLRLSRCPMCQPGTHARSPSGWRELQPSLPLPNINERIAMQELPQGIDALRAWDAGYPTIIKVLPPRPAPVRIPSPHTGKGRAASW